MFTITVRRTTDKQHYTVKGYKGGLATLPRPLTTATGLSEELIEKIVTCKREETRDISAADALALEKFAPQLKAQPAEQAVTLKTNAPALSFEQRCAQHNQTLKQIGQNGLSSEIGTWAVFEPVWASFTCQQGENDDCAESWGIAIH